MCESSNIEVPSDQLVTPHQTNKLPEFLHKGRLEIQGAGSVDTRKPPFKIVLRIFKLDREREGTNLRVLKRYNLIIPSHLHAPHVPLRREHLPLRKPSSPNISKEGVGAKVHLNFTQNEDVAFKMPNHISNLPTLKAITKTPNISR